MNPEEKDLESNMEEDGSLAKNVCNLMRWALYGAWVRMENVLHSARSIYSALIAARQRAGTPLSLSRKERKAHVRQIQHANVECKQRRDVQSSVASMYLCKYNL